MTFPIITAALIGLAVIDEYDRMVEEFGFIVIDASQSIGDQQAEMRAAVTVALEGARQMEVRA